MRQEALEWRPSLSCLQRGIKGLESMALCPPNPWLPETLSMALFSSLLCEINLSSLDPDQRDILFDFFIQAMYFNRHLDPLTRKAQRGRKSLEFAEEFWALPQRLADLKKRSEAINPQSNSAKLLEESLEEWFYLNRILNFTSYQITTQGWAPWNNYESQIPIEPGEFYPKNTDKERKILAVIREAFEKWDGKTPTQKAILFRSFSSVGFAKQLAILGSRQPLKQTAETIGIIRRMGAMIMITQTIDDFSTPVKDDQYQILGIIMSHLRERGISSGKPLYLDKEETKRAVSISREIIGACLEIINIDPENKIKHGLSHYGIPVIAALAFLVMKKKHGGTKYSFSCLVRQGLQEIRPQSQTENGYAKITKEALKMAVDSLTRLNEPLFSQYSC